MYGHHHANYAFSRCPTCNLHPTWCARWVFDGIVGLSAEKSGGMGALISGCCSRLVSLL